MYNYCTCKLYGIRYLYVSNLYVYYWLYSKLITRIVDNNTRIFGSRICNKFLVFYWILLLFKFYFAFLHLSIFCPLALSFFLSPLRLLTTSLSPSHSIFISLFIHMYVILQKSDFLFYDVRIGQLLNRLNGFSLSYCESINANYWISNFLIMQKNVFRYIHTMKEKKTLEKF